MGEQLASPRICTWTGMSDQHDCLTLGTLACVDLSCDADDERNVYSNVDNSNAKAPAPYYSTVQYSTLQ